jgi:hypothetical protein
MKKYELTYDLQFFADGESEDEGVNESEAAEQTEGDEEGSEEEGEEDDSEEEPERDYEHDRQMAAARRQGEKDMRARYDAMAAELCKGRVNPVTGEPITNLDQYFDAISAQRRQSIQSELQQKGVDPSMIDAYIANSPEIQQQKQMLAQMQERDAQNRVKEDIKTIMSLDKAYATEDDLIASDGFKKAVEMCNNIPGLDLVNAYKSCNFDSLRSEGVKAAKQAAINETKGKGHLTASSKTPKGNAAMEVPEAELWKWKKFYPDKSTKELNALYAKVHS